MGGMGGNNECDILIGIGFFKNICVIWCVGWWCVIGFG